MRATFRPRTRILLLATLALALGCGDEAPDRPGADAASDGAPPDLGTPDGPPPGDWGPPPDGGGPYVEILQPKNGATVNNPVTFVIAAQQVATVQIFADQWPLSPAWDPQTKTSLTYSFSGVNYARQIELVGYDGQGKTVASHGIQITVAGSQDKGQLVGQMWITYYFLAKETDYPGAADTTLYDSQCAPIVQVSAAFSDAVCIEGSGLLQDGRVINYASTCSCGRPCPTGGIVCYSVLDKATYPWGMGAASNPLVPLRSWAVDKSQIPIGTVLYAEEWDGVTIPQKDGLGGFIHDGCFKADDVGGAITGLHYDFFAGTKAMWLALEQIHGTKSNFTVYKNGGRCAYLQP